MYAAALDTNVLWPSLRRDFLLSLAVTNVYRPVWSDVVLEELEYHEAQKLISRGMQDLEAERCANRLITAMQVAFGDATVFYTERVAVVGLPDLHDEHVVGAAVLGGAEVIVTENHKDFPEALLPDDLHTMSSAQFANAMVVAQPAEAAEAVAAMSGRRQNPPQSPLDLVDVLDLRYGMSEAAEVLRDWV